MDDDSPQPKKPIAHDPAAVGPQQGEGVTGNAPDPTGNVLLLVEAATRRTDDLLKVHILRMDDLRKSEILRIDKEMILRADYEGKLRDAEAKRIDAIRAVDVNAVAVASERAADQATVLANQVSASAETLRNLVASTATTQATVLAQITTQLTDRLASLEKAQYEGTGKQAVADPQMANLIRVVGELSAKGEQGVGKTAGIDTSWKILLAAASFIATLLFIASVIVAIAFAIRQ